MYLIDCIIILATVITNLFSAIPFVGQDLVPFNIILPLYLYIYICKYKLKSNIFIYIL